MADAKLIEALESLAKDEFQTGPNWKSCHALCAKNSGIDDYDWVHALCHRIEGDLPNARYWYGRAGRDASDDPFEDECQQILQEFQS